MPVLDNGNELSRISVGFSVGVFFTDNKANFPVTLIVINSAVLSTLFDRTQVERQFGGKIPKKEPESTQRHAICLTRAIEGD